MQYTLVSLPYLLYVPSLYFLCAYPCNIQVFQAAKDIEIGSDTVVDVLESVERLFRHLSIYARIPHSLALDEMVVKIVMELLSILALATKQLARCRMSKSILVNGLLYPARCSEIFKEPYCRGGRRSGTAEIGTTRTRSGADGCSGDSQSRPLAWHHRVCRRGNGQ